MEHTRFEPIPVDPGEYMSKLVSSDRNAMKYEQMDKNVILSRYCVMCS